MSDSDRLNELAWDLVRAIQEPGPNPKYHRQQVSHIRLNWPTLWDAITAIIDEVQVVKRPEVPEVSRE